MANKTRPENLQKREMFQVILDSDPTITITEVAKQLEIPVATAFNWVREFGYVQVKVWKR